jgi:DNA-binding response OmpR family regulator
VPGVVGEPALQKPPRGPVPAVSPEPPLRSRVLVIEDDTDILGLTARVLGTGYTILTADNGRDGIELARNNVPDLILLDLYMEGMDGLEVLAALKEDEKTKDIPVAMFTAGAQRWEVEMGYKAGADDYITKPFKPDELLAKVRELVSAKNKVD